MKNNIPCYIFVIIGFIAFLILLCLIRRTEFPQQEGGNSEQICPEQNRIILTAKDLYYVRGGNEGGLYVYDTSSFENTLIMQLIGELVQTSNGPAYICGDCVYLLKEQEYKLIYVLDNNSIFLNYINDNIYISENNQLYAINVSKSVDGTDNKKLIYEAPSEHIISQCVEKGEYICITTFHPKCCMFAVIENRNMSIKEARIFYRVKAINLNSGIIIKAYYKSDNTPHYYMLQEGSIMDINELNYDIKTTDAAYCDNIFVSNNLIRNEKDEINVFTGEKVWSFHESDAPAKCWSINNRYLAERTYLDEIVLYDKTNEKRILIYEPQK